MLESLISSKTRIHILMRLFLNPKNSAYLRELASDFNCSSGQIGYELKQLSQAHLVKKKKSGRNVFYKANTEHPLFPDLRSMVMKALGMTHIVETVLGKLGDLKRALIIDDYAEGKDSGIIDLLLVGGVDGEYLSVLVKSAEKHMQRKIRTLVLTVEEYRRLKPGLDRRPQLVLWDENVNGCSSAGEGQNTLAATTNYAE